MSTEVPPPPGSGSVASAAPRRSGMLLGKFLPPHLGHVYLVDFARGYADDLTVVVCTLDREPIPGALRYGWMRELFPTVNVVHLSEDIPQEPSEHPEFWRIWREALQRLLPGRPDLVFASEPYGLRLAQELGGEFVPVDQARRAVPVSGTAVRRDPMRCWPYIPVCVRPYFLKRVCLFGPESTGKSTLAGELAAHFGTVAVQEYARTYLEARSARGDTQPVPIDYADMERIARGQVASEEALARQASRILICDTDVLLTQVWSEVLFGRCAPWIHEEARRRTYDLTLLMDTDVPWVADPVRYLPGDRAGFFARCEQALAQVGRTAVVLRGSWQERRQTAIEAVTALLQEPAAADETARPGPRP